MKWLIQEIKKIPRLRKYAIYIRSIINKSYMFLSNKLCGIRSKKVVFVSFSGKSYSDNPKAISEKLYEVHPEFEIVWLFNNPEEKRNVVPSYVRCIKHGSFKALKELATARCWVDNFTKPTYFYKSKKQVYIQTWHGDRGFKKILYDSTFFRNEHRYIEERVCNLMIAGSDFAHRVYNTAFNYSGEVLKIGCPRNDKLIENNSALKNKVRDSLNMNQKAKVLLYAPTLRREASSKRICQPIGDIDLLQIISTLEKKTKGEWICFLRAHSAVTGLSYIPKGDKFIDVTSYEDMNDLLLISDILITDYSSSAGDFALLNRPIILFQNDREEYLKKDRTFYFDIDKSPFLVAKNQEELLSIIGTLDANLICKNCRDILKFYGTNETGKASEQVVSYIVSKTQE